MYACAFLILFCQTILTAKQVQEPHQILCSTRLCEILIICPELLHVKDITILNTESKKEVFIYGGLMLLQCSLHSYPDTGARPYQSHDAVRKEACI